MIAAAHYGGFISGTDIDYLTLHGKSKPTRAHQKKRQPSESIKGNLQQYGLLSQYVDVFVGDASRPVWRPSFTFDAILTDRELRVQQFPYVDECVYFIAAPYGIREPTERVGSNRGLPVPEEFLQTHYPQKTKYDLGEIFKDLLNLAAERLKMNGRLVFWIPVMRYCIIPFTCVIFDGLFPFKGLITTRNFYPGTPVSKLLRTTSKSLQLTQAGGSSQ